MSFIHFIGIKNNKSFGIYQQALSLQRFEKLLKLAERAGDEKAIAIFQKGISKFIHNYMAQTADYSVCHFLINKYERSDNPTLVEMGNKAKEILTEYRERFNKLEKENSP